MSRLEKAVIELKDELIKAKYISKKPDGKGGWIYTYPKDLKGREKKIEEKKESKPVEQTETPEFKKWFGDSKVVDSEASNNFFHYVILNFVKKFNERFTYERKTRT